MGGGHRGTHAALREAMQGEPQDRQLPDVPAGTGEVPGTA